MKTLLILRHAKSSWDNPHLTDHDRPLNARGENDAPRMGEFLAKEDMVPDLIVTSTARRARDTALKAAKAAGYEGEIRETEDLYHADPETCMDVVTSFDDTAERVMVVAHNPGLQEWVESLSEGAYTGKFPTAALARFDWDVEGWSEVSKTAPTQFVNVWKPKDLKT